MTSPIIPKRIFRIWLGPKPPRTLFQVWWERFHEIHPGWELLTIKDGRPFLGGEDKLKKIFNYCSTYAEKTDVLRYAVLYKIGGIYVDSDVFPIKPFDDFLMNDPRPFLCWLSGTKTCVEIAVMGSPPKHPAIRAVMDELPKHYWNHKEESPLVCTGPKFVSKVFIPRQDVRILPKETFLPVERCKVREFMVRCLKSDGYACHFAAGGWWAEAKRRKKTGVRKILPGIKERAAK